MLEIHIEDYKYFLWECKNERSLLTFAERFYDTFKIDKNVYSHILEIENEDEARREIFKKFLVH